MALHELKSWPENFRAVYARRKNHEVRKFDRPFAVGDMLKLREWDPERKRYTGEFVCRYIADITPPGAFGLPADIGVLGLK